jgi:hypothetical protein
MYLLQKYLDKNQCFSYSHFFNSSSHNMNTCAYIYQQK